MLHSARRVSLGVTGALATGCVVAATAVAAVIPGTNGDDRIRGTRAADQIDAKAGDDYVLGRTGADTIVGAEGDDRLFGNRGADTINGVQGADQIWGNRGDDTLRGDAPDAGDRVSPDRIYGGRGSDKVYGGDGTDRLHGGPADDLLFGELGDDFQSGGRGNDTQYGGPGNDLIFANVGVDVTYGGAGNDTLWALARRDIAFPGGDALYGEDGDDRFRTRDGEADGIDCGPGIDTAFLDFKDVIAGATAQNPNGNCEVVQRAAPSPREQREEDRKESPATDERESL